VRSGLVIVAGPGAKAAASAFRAAGYEVRAGGPIEATPENVAVLLEHNVPAALRSADLQGVRYVLVHVGEVDDEPGGSFARAHHRVGVADLPALAERVRVRERRLVTCLAFAYKQGLPSDATWLVDVRFLENPYWVPELRERTGATFEIEVDGGITLENARSAAEAGAGVVVIGSAIFDTPDCGRATKQFRELLDGAATR